MMEKDKLRKADIFSGSVIVLFGLWVVSQALKMPMKDSWGGVQNVWFVSPAIFPLLVGAMIVLLGALLIRTAFKAVGAEELGRILRWLCSRQLARHLNSAATLRFCAIAALFLCLVYLNIPRVDFFLCSVLFLMALTSMFYLDDDALIGKMLIFYLVWTGCFFVYLVSGLPGKLAPVLPYPNDWVTLVFIFAFGIYTWTLVRGNAGLRKKYRTGMILAVVSPFVICPIFKYFLLVPMPTEGLVVAVMDAIWYFEF